jgi:hypothetical protein
MSGYSDEPREFDDRDDRRGGGRDEQTVAAARAAIAAPAIFIILNGLLGLALAAILSVPMVFQPEMFIKMLRDMVAQQPQGPDRQDAEKKLDDAEKQIQQNRAATQIQNAVQLGVLAVGNLLAVLGGFAMRSLGSYGLGMTGAIVSVIPCVTGCCCTGMPFGIWALVVLLRPEVKAGYAAKRRLAASPGLD